MQMSNQLTDLLKTLTREWYEGKITRHDHFNDIRDIDAALNMEPKHFTIKDRRRYTESCFGHFLWMHWEMKYSVEFCLINGLKFGVIPDTTRYETVENRIHERYFSGREEVEYEQLNAFRGLVDLSSNTML
ncbi:hypothetical protein Ddye_000681 [Dipteronia dyeriana]|uniref:Uncharacterized protein n=1 Tax=Dipteronia dyeriana TaxID=168575 RepID=A0AAD9XMJ9_9ROSI|nr:hypothetical protein Ddye_000681 [Dipteronia dyeriana]